MALTSDIRRYWYQATGPARSNHCTTLLASATIYHGAVAMEVDGKAQRALSGSSMAAKCTAFGSGNSLVYASARQPNVTLELDDPSANSAVEYVTVTPGATTAILVSLATDGGGAITSTPNTIVQSIRRHAAANAILRVKAGGTGASAVVAAAATAIAFIRLLGVPQRKLSDATGSDVTLAMDEGVFDLGVYRMAGSSAPTLAGGLVSISDDATITKTIDPLDLLAPLRVIEGSNYYVDLAAAL